MKVVVIGGGASGMMCAYSSSLHNQVILLEKNEKLGKKIYITGKGRCNLTNNCSVNEFLSNVVTNSKFLYSSLSIFSTENTINFFEDNNLKLKTERGNRVFPVSDKSSDVIKTLEKTLINNGVDIRLNTLVTDILCDNGRVSGVATDKGIIACDKVVVCTGGFSYPLTGSTGDGYTFAKRLGHTISPIIPSLVGLELYGEDYKRLQGLSLKNVKISVKLKKDGRKVYDDFGEMLFSHYGISGPIVLSSSCVINKMNLSDLIFTIDLKPALNNDVLDSRLVRDFEDNKNKNIINVLYGVVPKSLAPIILSRTSISAKKQCCEITKEERQRLVLNLKNLTFSIKKLRPIEEAIVTSGGVNTCEINPKTMESRLVKGLFFAGEVIDVDAFTGGFNLQIAFSTGYLAGNN